MIAALRWLLLVALSAGGCASSLREKVTPFPPGTRTTVPWTLNRELLMPVNQRIVFVVELAQGHPPDTAALDTLVRLARRYGERPATWVVGTMSNPGPLDRDTSYVFVRYVGDKLQKWGLSYTNRVQGRLVYVLEINQERHRRWRQFIPERHLEAQTLVHEYGHLLGLPPADHGYYVLYPSFYDGAHCVNPDCALTKPRFRALLYGLFHTLLGRHYLEDYCAACRQAIKAAKDYWRGQVASPLSSARKVIASRVMRPARGSRSASDVEQRHHRVGVFGVVGRVGLVDRRRRRRDRRPLSFPPSPGSP